MADPGIEERLRPLAAALRDGGLARVRVVEPGFEIEVRRAARDLPLPASAGGAPERPATGAAAETVSRLTEVVASDVVGIVRYLRPPVGEGHPIDGDRELAFVEALGVRNAVRSRGAGRIAAVFVEDGQPVEYGQPIFAIER